MSVYDICTLYEFSEIFFYFHFLSFSLLGESSLHLAARYARADAAKILLEAGADPNAQDCTGRTPLHTSVSADAQGVFQVNVLFFFGFRSTFFYKNFSFCKSF